MDVYLNDNKVEGELDTSGAVRDVVMRVQDRYCGEGHVVMSIHCDGAEIDPEAMAEMLARPAGDVGRLEVHTSSKSALVHDAMAQSSATLGHTEAACRRVAELIHEGEAQEGIELLGQCLHVWQQIHEAVAKSIAMLELDADAITIRDEPLVDIIGMPKDSLLQIKQALTSKDHVLLADILQYEFSEVTDRWHAVISLLRHEAEERLEESPSS